MLGNTEEKRSASSRTCRQMCVPLFYQKSIYLSIYLSRATMGHLGLGDGWAPQLGLPQPGLGNPAAVASPAVTSRGPPRAIGRPADSAAGRWERWGGHYWPRRARRRTRLSQGKPSCRLRSREHAGTASRAAPLRGSTQAHGAARPEPRGLQCAQARARGRLPALPAGSAAARTRSV